MLGVFLGIAACDKDKDVDPPAELVDIVAKRTPGFTGADLSNAVFPFMTAQEIAVGDVPVRHDRQAWVVWEEGGRYPDVIVELLSPSTMKKDRTVKKDFYAKTFRTAEYYLYRIERQALEGFRLAGGGYQPMKPEASGRFWSERGRRW